MPYRYCIVGHDISLRQLAAAGYQPVCGSARAGSPDLHCKFSYQSPPCVPSDGSTQRQSPREPYPRHCLAPRFGLAQHRSIRCEVGSGLTTRKLRSPSPPRSTPRRGRPPPPRGRPGAVFALGSRDVQSPPGFTDKPGIGPAIRQVQRECQTGTGHGAGQLSPGLG